MTAPGRAQELAGAGPRAARLLSPFADDEVPVVLARLSCGQAITDGGLKLSDKDLLKHLRGADADAAEALINTYGARAYRLAVRITGSEADAEEVAQDALWTVVRRVEMFRGDAALGTWIYRITANASHDKLRRRRRQREVPWDDRPTAFNDDERQIQSVDDRSEQAGDPAVQSELRTILTAAIDNLRVVDRTVFVLHDVDGRSNPDIAATLDLTVGAVKSRVRRARLLLRRQLLGLPAATPDPVGSGVAARRVMPQRCRAISWHLRSWPMNAVRRDLRSHYISMMVDRYVAQHPGGWGERPRLSSNSDSRSGFDRVVHPLLTAGPSANRLVIRTLSVTVSPGPRSR